jgi:hypothetical protein
MPASIRRVVCKAMREIIESNDTKASDKLKACRVLMKFSASARKGKPRGPGFAKKRAQIDHQEPKDRISSLIAGLPRPN